MKPLVEFCINNYPLGTEKVAKIIENVSDADVLENTCLGYCENCTMIPFAVFEGEYIEAPTSEDLLLLINEQIKIYHEFNELYDRIIED